MLLPHCIISICKRVSCVISGADLGFSSWTVYVLLISLRHDGRHFLFRHWSSKEEKPFGQSINRNVTELSDAWSKGLGVGDTVTEGPIFWNRDKYNMRGPRRAAGQLWLGYQDCQGRWRWRSRSSWKSLAWGELKGTSFLPEVENEKSTLCSHKYMIFEMTTKAGNKIREAGTNSKSILVCNMRVVLL